MKLLQNLFALAVFFFLAIGLIYVGVYILLAVLIVSAAAFAWFGVKFYFLRKEIDRAVHEHQTARHSGMSYGAKVERDAQGPVIDGEYEEIRGKNRSD